MENKIYLVRYYMDYSTNGIHAIFTNKEDADKCVKMMAEKEENIGLRYSIHESRVYDSFDKYISRWDVTE